MFEGGWYFGTEYTFAKQKRMMDICRFSIRAIYGTTVLREKEMSILGMISMSMGEQNGFQGVAICIEKR